MSSENNPNNSQQALWPILRPFQHRNFSIFFVGQGISLIGTWMASIATSWLTYRLTGSAALLGVMGFLSNIPLLILGPFTGGLADRFNRLTIVKIAQITEMILAAILAYLTLSGIINVWHLMILGFLLGVTFAFEIPARQALIIHMVGLDDLPNAIGINAAMFNGARMIGPAIAGAIIATFGEGVCFTINALSFLAVIFSLYSLKLVPFVKSEVSESVFYNIRQGFVSSFSDEATRKTLLLVAYTGLMGMPFLVLLPPYIKNVLAGNATLYGWVMACSGAGAMTAALTLVQRVRIVSLPNRIGLANLWFGIGILLFALIPYVPLGMIIIAGLSFAAIVQAASSNTLVQMVVSDNMRGRVMGIYSMMFLGMLPIGALIWGFIIEHLGSQIAFSLMGAGLIISGTMYLKNRPTISHPTTPHAPHTFAHGPSAQ